MEYKPFPFSVAELEKISSYLNGMIREIPGFPIADVAKVFFNNTDGFLTEIKLFFNDKKVMVFHYNTVKNTPAIYEAIISDIFGVKYSVWAGFGPGIKFLRKVGGFIRIHTSGVIRVEI
jgi:hypothetical protein